MRIADTPRTLIAMLLMYFNDSHAFQKHKYISILGVYGGAAEGLRLLQHWGNFASDLTADAGRLPAVKAPSIVEQL